MKRSGGKFPFILSALQGGDVMSVPDRETDATTEWRPSDEGYASDCVSPDDAFHVLRNPRRRLLVRLLADAAAPVEMRELAERVAARENETTVEAIDSDQRQRAYVSLYQTHLPKMDELDVVDYDQDRGTVERRPAVDQLVEHIRVADGESPFAVPRPGRAPVPGPDADVAGSTPPGRTIRDEHFLLVSVIGATLLLAAAVNAGPLAALPGSLIAGAVVAAVAVLSVGRLAERATPLPPSPG
jgi:hypothetical protein